MEAAFKLERDDMKDLRSFKFDPHLGRVKKKKAVFLQISTMIKLLKSVEFSTPSSSNNDDDDV